MPPKGRVETFEPSESHQQFLRSHGLASNLDGDEYWNSEQGQEHISKAISKMLRWDFPEAESREQEQLGQVSRGLAQTWYKVSEIMEEFHFRTSPSREQVWRAIQESRSQQGRRFASRYSFDESQPDSYLYEVSLNSSWLEYARRCQVKGQDVYGHSLAKGKGSKDHHNKGENKGEGKGKGMGKMQGQKGPQLEPPGPPPLAIVLARVSEVN